jgi:hypothetical protein
MLLKTRAPSSPELTSRFSAPQSTLAVFVFLLALLFAGIEGCRGPGNGLAPYGWTFYNLDTAEINKVYFSYDVSGTERKIEVGVLSSSNGGGGVFGKSWVYRIDDLPKQGALHWIAADGSNRTQPVDLTRVVSNPNNFDGMICFAYRDGHWTAFAASRDDQASGRVTIPRE